MSERISQQFALLACIDPQGVTASSTTTCDVIDASLYDSLMFVLSAGAVTSSGKYTMTIYKGTVATVGSITSAVASVTMVYTDDNKQEIVDVDVSAEGNYRYYKARIVANGGTASGGSFYSLHVFGAGTRFHPASDNDLSSATVTLA